MDLTERMKKYAGRMYTHEETEMLSDLQATVRALEVAREGLQYPINIMQDSLETHLGTKCAKAMRKAIKIIDEALGERI